jgi:hypothetical protein
VVTRTAALRGRTASTGAGTALNPVLTWAGG